MAIISTFSSPSSAAQAIPQQSYCTGYGNGKPDILWGSESNAHLSAAVKLDKDMLKGTSLVALKFFMDKAPKMRDCQIFLTKNINSAGRMYEQEFTPTEGWNYVWLDNPLAIDGIEKLYIGYEATCSGRIIGAAATTESAGESDLVRNGNGDWQSLSDLQQRSCELALSAILTGGDYSDLQQTGISFMPDQQPAIVKAYSPVVITGMAINTGVNTLSSIRWGYSVDGIAAQETGTIETELVNYATSQVSIPVTVGSGTHLIEITLTGEGGSYSTACLTVDAYERAYPESPLVEIFTSQYCSNCPDGDAVLERVIDLTKVEATRITHHAGFIPDYFTIPESETIAETFGVGSAPSMMLNRTPVNINAEPSLVYHPGYSVPEHFTPFVKNNTLVGIEAYATWHTPDKILKTKITVGKDEAFAHGQLHLNVAICEDNVDGFQQDKGSVHTSYSHNHMPRIFLTPVPTGLPVEFDTNGNAVFEFTSTLPQVKNGLTGEPAEIAISNLRIVAFVASHDTDSHDYTVSNSASSPVEVSDESSLEAPVSANAAPFAIITGNTISVCAAQYAEVYDICGRCITLLPNGTNATLPDGIYILRADNGQVMKISIHS